MRRMHAIAISLLLGAGVAAGAAASLRTVHLGAAAAATTAAVPEKTIAARRAKLSRWSASLAKARAAKPPALPPVPHYAPVAMPTPPAVVSTPATPTAAPTAVEQPGSRHSKPSGPTVTYVQPPPIVQYQQATAPSTTTAAPVGEDEGSDDDHAAPSGHEDDWNGGDSRDGNGGDG